MSCVRFTPIARFYRNVLRSVHACCLPQSAKQDGLRGVAFLFRHGSGSPVARSRIAGAVIRISWFTSGLRVFCGDPDGSTRGRGGRRRRGVGAFLRDLIGFVAFSAGNTLGLRAPDCAKESSTLWTLFTLRRGCLSAYTRRHPGTRKDPSGSDLWPVRSCCIVLSFLALRGSKWNRHCRRAAPKRRGVGLRARSGEETALRSPPSAEESGCVREAVGMQTQFAGPTNANDGLAVSTARIASLTES